MRYLKHEHCCHIQQGTRSWIKGDGPHGMVRYLMRMMTDGVWAMAPIMLQAQMTQRKMRKASWQPGLGHFPGMALASSASPDIQAHPVRFWGDMNSHSVYPQSLSALSFVMHFYFKIELYLGGLKNVVWRWANQIALSECSKSFGEEHPKPVIWNLCEQTGVT